MYSYEMTFIVRPDMEEDATKEAAEQVTSRLESAGGEIIAMYPWTPSRRRMAYPIKDFADGVYVTTTFRLDGQGLKEIENSLKLNTNVLRYLIVRAGEEAIRVSEQRAQQAANPPPVPSPAPVVAPPEGGDPSPAVSEEAVAVPEEAVHDAPVSPPDLGPEPPVKDAQAEVPSPAVEETEPSATNEAGNTETENIAAGSDPASPTDETKGREE